MKIKLKDFQDMEKFFYGPNADRDFIYKNIHKSVEKAIINNLEEVLFCNVTFENGDESIDMTLHKEEYSKSLDNVLKWYESTDQFEKCIHVQTLKKRIDE